MRPRRSPPGFASRRRLMRDQVNYYLDRARAAALAGTLGTLTEVGARHRRARAHLREDLSRQGSRGRARDSAGSALPRREAGPRGDGRQPHRQRRQMGRPQGGGGSRDRARGRPVRASSCSSTTTARACRKRRGTKCSKRGRRLDETKPGSGLGLSIVSDLAALYRGSLRLDASPMGGLRAILELPGGQEASTLKDFSRVTPCHRRASRWARDI